MSKNKTNILITGGAGYVGSHVAKALIEGGYNVTVYDLNKCTFDYVNKNTVQVQGNILDTDKLTQTLKDNKIESVIHLAALTAANESVFEPADYYENNVSGTLSVLNAMRGANVDNIIFASTAAVYGFPDKPLITEDFETHPINPYGTTKLTCETMIQELSRAYDFNHIIFRFFNAVGNDDKNDVGNPKVNPTNLLPLTLEAANGKREELQIFGTDYNTHDGTAVRDYVHVNDLADAVSKGLEYLKDNKTNQLLNLGSGSGYSVMDVIRMVEKVTNKKLKIKYGPRRLGDPEKTIAVSNKAEKILDWKPNFTLEQMVQDSWNWINKK